MPTPEELARKNIDASAGELRLESSEARGGTPRQTLPPETCGRIPYDRQSKARPIPRPNATQQHDSHV